MAPPRKVRSCRRCGASELDGAVISQNYRCEPCVEAAVADNVTQLQAKRGPAWAKWAEGMARAAREAQEAAVTG